MQLLSTVFFGDRTVSLKLYRKIGSYQSSIIHQVNTIAAIILGCVFLFWVPKHVCAKCNCDVDVVGTVVYVDLGLKPTFFIFIKSVIFRKKGREGERSLSSLGVKAPSSALMGLPLSKTRGQGGTTC